MSNSLVTFTRPKGTVALPDNASYMNRFEIKSETSRRIYIIAQSKSGRWWSCSCPGWLRHRKCKHLQCLGLPCGQTPMEINAK